MKLQRCIDPIGSSPLVAAVITWSCPAPRLLWRQSVTTFSNVTYCSRNLHSNPFQSIPIHSDLFSARVVTREHGIVVKWRSRIPIDTYLVKRRRLPDNDTGIIREVRIIEVVSWNQNTRVRDRVMTRKHGCLRDVTLRSSASTMRMRGCIVYAFKNAFIVEM